MVEKLLQTFVGVDAATITPDAKEFYDGFVKEGYLVCGETYADCNAAEYGWGYDIQAARDAQGARAERKAYFHLPGLFELYDFYKKFLFIFFNYREFFYDWAAIGSIYGAPAFCVWNSGRERNVGKRDTVKLAHKLTQEYGVSARFTFSNGLLEEKHLSDTYCNYLLELFQNENNGIILQSDLLQGYIAKNFPKYYFVSSTTKCITQKEEFFAELDDNRFKFVVPDYNFNNDFEVLGQIPQNVKPKIELLCNAICVPSCPERQKHYKAISEQSIYVEYEKYKCGLRKDTQKFSAVKKKKHFISREDILNKYISQGFSNFKIEGRCYGELRLLEELLYYMVKPEYQLEVREMMYLTPWANFPEEKS